MKNLIDNNDLNGIRNALTANPALANEGLPFDEFNPSLAHPLHRICDAVFTRRLTDSEAVKVAQIFLEHGADVNGNHPAEKQDSPLIAAASLHADQVAFLYLDHGADIHHRGTHGGTALHWAAWCGRDKLVRRLVEAVGEINQKCIDFQSTPLFWAVHGLKNNGNNNLKNYLECVRILLEAGADKTIPNADGKTVFDLLDAGDVEMRALLSA